MKRRVRGAAVLALALGCASSEPAKTPWLPARLTVDVVHGFEPAELGASPSESPVVMLVDATRSTDRPSSVGTALGLGARRAASRFLDSLPAGSPVWLYGMGAAGGEACRPPAQLARAGGRSAREPVVDALARLRTGGESGLAASLDRVRADLGAAGLARDSRVVVFSDLAGDCGGDVCAAAAALVKAGARLDVVVIGPAPAPACLREPGDLDELAPPAVAEGRGRTRYHLEVARPETMVVGCSQVGGPPVAAPAGRATVVVELDPPLRVDASFTAGRHHVLEVLDFPALEPPTRRWRWREAPVPEDRP